MDVKKKRNALETQCFQGGVSFREYSSFDKRYLIDSLAIEEGKVVLELSIFVN